jgi:hypothetical protein
MDWTPIVDGMVEVVLILIVAMLAYGAYLALGGGRMSLPAIEDDAHPRLDVGADSRGHAP